MPTWVNVRFQDGVCRAILETDFKVVLVVWLFVFLSKMYQLELRLLLRNCLGTGLLTPMFSPWVGGVQFLS